MLQTIVILLAAAALAAPASAPASTGPVLPVELGDGSPEPAPDAAPAIIHYQGRFTDPGGAPLPGPVDLVFRLHTAAQGGATLWTETHDDVPLNEGVATVLLGSLASFPGDAFVVADRWLSITVNGAGLTPRLRLASVPFALEANRLQGKTSSDFEPKGAVIALSINDGSPPNTGSNRVHWNNLTGVPVGFADGEDTGVVVHAELTGLDADDHPQYLLRDDAATSDGTEPNIGSNLVHWENLVGVPSGFADGADNTGASLGDHGELQGLEDDDHPHYVRDAELDAHTGEAEAHHARTTDAGDLTTGILDAARLPGEAIDSTHVRDASIAAADLAPGILDSLTLSEGSVDSATIAPGAVAGVHLAPGAVDSVHLAAGAITGAAIAGETVTGGNVADGSLTGADVLDGTLVNADLADGPGFEYAVFSPAQALGDTEVILLQADITCPADGWVLVSATAQVCVQSPPSTGDNFILLSLADSLDAGDPDTEATFRVLAQIGAVDCGSLATQKAYPVTAGTATFFVRGRAAGDAAKSVSNLALSMVFLPARY